MKLTKGRTLVFFLLFGAYSLSVKGWLARSAIPDGNLMRGEVAPTFTLEAIEGEPVDLKATTQRSKVVVLSFWATWCGPCRLEMPQFEQAYAELHQEGLEILALSSELPETIADYLTERPLDFRVLVDKDGAVAKAYGVEVLPTTVLLDKDGRVIAVHRGLRPGFRTILREQIRVQSDE